MNITTKRDFNITSGVMSCLVIPQDGVVNRSMHYDSGGAASHFDVGSARGHRNGNVGPGDGLKRPKMLEVAPKSCREDSEVEDGSLPCTPEQLSYGELDVSACPGGYDALDATTKQIVIQFLRTYTGCPKSRSADGKVLETLTRVVQGVVEKHRYAFNGMISKLSLDKKGDDMSFICEVAESLFSDGHTNWGRIVSLMAFAAVVCQHLKEMGHENCVEEVGQEVSSYLLSDRRDWLVKNNSWDGFVEFFRVTDTESTARNTLMALAGFAGVWATISLLIR